MAIGDIRRSVLEIVNEVQIRMGLNPTSSLTETKHAQTLLSLLNMVIDDLSDFGDWPETYLETSVAAVGGVGEYTISAGLDLVKSIEEISFGGDTAPLDVVDPQDLRQLHRLGTKGRPRQFAVVGVDGGTGNPKVRVWPIPTTAMSGEDFTVCLYVKPPLYTTRDGRAEPPFPAAVVIQGLYAQALLEENDGEPGPQSDAQFALYEKMKHEAINRYTGDTGTDVRFVPRMGRRG